MIQTDVIIIGGGPAGSVAAQRLASAGLKAVLLERAVFPRDKTCGDMVAFEGLQALERTGLAEWSAAFHPVTRLRFSAPNATTLDVAVNNRHGGVVARLIPRRLLDARLAQAAGQAGAKVMDGAKAEEVSFDDRGRPRVKAGSQLLQAEMLLLADGSHAPITRKLGLLKGEVDLVAMQQYLAGDSDPDGPLEFHFTQGIIPGYVWMFPMGDGHINIGAGTYTRRARGQVNLRQALDDLRSRHPLDPARLARTEPLTPMRGHPLHTRLSITRTHSARTLVLGDAAGLISPFTGEGIAAALRSGEMAAAQTRTAFEKGDFSAAALAPYTAQLKARYQRDKQAGNFLRSLLGSAGLLNSVISKLSRNPQLGTLFGQIFMDEISPMKAFSLRTIWQVLI
ncbi:MAG TPA: NAD(P)/FAD-dependent oxidoreductase [Anaerolineaceae bacterium]|nr:NAD(P)/FAD-dependent oxidoreductase [Anaerolineaceae bacterium]HPN51567.1 NAD(P)/FAD-dependent oxidoreductase [Anaerolineaceae bacterium]